VSAASLTSVYSRRRVGRSAAPTPEDSPAAAETRMLGWRITGCRAQGGPACKEGVAIMNGLLRHVRSVRLVGSAVLVVLLFAFSSGALGQDYIIDQSFEGGLGLSYSIPMHDPLGQEITPALDHVDVVEFCTDDMDYGPPSPPPSLLVEIRDDSISGPLLGTSDVVCPEDGFAGVTRFTFGFSVPLVPGQRYVLRLRQVSGQNWGMQFDGFAIDRYLGGRLIVYGQPRERQDTWFREGVWPVSAAASSTWSRIKLLFR
jgi:hypothetical protein